MRAGQCDTMCVSYMLRSGEVQSLNVSPSTDFAFFGDPPSEQPGSCRRCRRGETCEDHSKGSVPGSNCLGWSSHSAIDLFTSRRWDLVPPYNPPRGDLRARPRTQQSTERRRRRVRVLIDSFLVLASLGGAQAALVVGVVARIAELALTLLAGGLVKEMIAAAAGAHTGRHICRSARVRFYSAAHGMDARGIRRSARQYSLRKR